MDDRLAIEATNQGISPERELTHPDFLLSSYRRSVDYEDQADRYHAGRALLPEALQAWRRAISPYLPLPSGLPIPDLGSGTGKWSGPLSEWFRVPVVAVEPSDGMLRVALLKPTGGRVIHLRGRGEAIPLRDGSCGAAWLSTVVHHISDLPRCARELRRVLIAGSPVLIRSAFSGRTDQALWLRFFPEAIALAQRRWPSLDEVVEVFSSAGFGLVSVQTVSQIIAHDLREYVERIRTRADSTLRLLDNETFNKGLALMERAAAAETKREPIIDLLDLLVLR